MCHSPEFRPPFRTDHPLVLVVSKLRIKNLRTLMEKKQKFCYTIGRSNFCSIADEVKKIIHLNNVKCQCLKTNLRLRKRGQEGFKMTQIIEVLGNKELLK